MSACLHLFFLVLAWQSGDDDTTTGKSLKVLSEECTRFEEGEFLPCGEFIDDLFERLFPIDRFVDYFSDSIKNIAFLVVHLEHFIEAFHHKAFIRQGYFNFDFVRVFTFEDYCPCVMHRYDVERLPEVRHLLRY